MTMPNPTPTRELIEQQPVTDLEVDWATISTPRIVATLRALVPLVSPDRNMELIAEAANRLAARTDPLRAIMPEVIEALEGWRGIESAPKFQPHTEQMGICVAQLWGTRWSFHHAWWDDAVDQWTDISSDRYLTPTHWMPLPTPPSQTPPQE